MLTVLFAGFLGIVASWWGLVLLVTYLFIIGALFEDDWWFRGFIFLAVPVGIAYLAGVVGVPSFTQLGLLFGGYFIAGAIWSIYKWIVFVKDLKRDLTKHIETGRFTNGKTGTAYMGQLTWAELDKEAKGKALYEFIVHGEGSKYIDFLSKDKVRDDLNVTPHLSTWGNRAKIFTWIMYWPFSVIKYVFERLLKDLVDWIIDSLKGIYNRIAEDIMKGLQI